MKQHMFVLKLRVSGLVIVLAFLCCLISTKNVFAASYYVDSFLGDDAAIGTDIAHSWKTINKVNGSNFQPGDNVLFKKGSTWIGEILTVPSSGAVGNLISIGAYGSGANPVFDGGGTAGFGIFLDGKSYLNISSLTLKNYTSVNAHCISVSNLSHHINISNVSMSDSYGGISLWNGPHDVIISDIDISKMTYSGILWYNTGSNDSYNITIENFHVHDFNPTYSYFHGISFYWGVGGATGKPHNITIKDGSLYNLKGNSQINAGLLFTTEDDRITGHSVTIDNLDIYEVDGGGISIGSIDDTGQTTSVIKNSRIHDNSYHAPIGGIWVAGCVGMVVEDNTIYNNHTNTRWEGNGLYFDWAGAAGSPVSHNCIARRNIIYGHDDIKTFKPLGSEYGANSAGIAFTQGVYDIDVYQNIVYGNTEGISAYYDKSPSATNPPGLDSPHDLNIYNNVAVDNETGVAKAGNGQNVKLRNNVVAFNASYGIVNLILWDSTSTPLDSDYNDVHSNGTNFVNNTSGAHSISADPSFKNRNNHDYHLNGNSPCINAGESTNLFSADFDGKSIVGQVDMGAFEYQNVLSSEKTITAFMIPNQIGSTTINESAYTISLTMPFGTSLTALVPTITITGTTVNPISGVVQNFTNPVNYIVTAADASTQTYVVTVTIATAPLPTTKDIISFSFNSFNPVIYGVINNVSETVKIIVPFGTNITTLVPTIAHSGVAISPVSGLVQDFTLPISYTVMAQDNSTKIYVVTVAVGGAIASLDDNAGISFDRDDVEDERTNKKKVRIKFNNINAVAFMQSGDENFYGEAWQEFDGDTTMKVNQKEDKKQKVYFKFKYSDGSISGVFRKTIEYFENKRVVKNSQKKLTIGETIVESGTNFSKNGIIILHFSKADGSYYPPKIIQADKHGAFSLSYIIPAGKQSARYYWYAEDTMVGRNSEKAYFNVE